MKEYTFGQLLKLYKEWFTGWEQERLEILDPIIDWKVYIEKCGNTILVCFEPPENSVLCD